MLGSTWLRAVPLLFTVLGFASLACSGGDDDEKGNDPYTGGNLSPAQLCSNVATDQCDKRFSCNPQTDRIDCFGNGLDQLRCASATPGTLCAGMAVSVQQVAACSSQIKAASCEQIQSGNVASYAPDCGPCALRR